MPGQRRAGKGCSSVRLAVVGGGLFGAGSCGEWVREMGGGDARGQLLLDGTLRLNGPSLDSLLILTYSARLEQESGCNVCRGCVLFTQHVTYSKTGLSVGEHLSLRSILAIRPIVGYKRRTEV